MEITLNPGRKWTLAATSLCGVLLAAVPVLASRDEMPKIVIPAPKPLPKPNAFDFYVRAGKMRVKTPRDPYYRNPPLAVLQSAAKLNAPSLRCYGQVNFALCDCTRLFRV